MSSAALPIAVSPHDPDALPPGWPPALHLLLGPAAGELWSAVLGPLGGRLHGLRALGVTLQPDGAATAQYSADVAWTDGRSSREVLAATTGSRIPPGAAVVAGEADGTTVEVGLWRWPLDPALPALRWAASAAGVGARLADLGLGTGRPTLRLRGYRPGRRAVVEATTPEGRFFVKVVRPSAAGRLVRRHATLAGPVPVPPVLAATDDGAVVLPGLPGTPLRTLLAGDGSGLPRAADLDAVLDALPTEVAGLSAPGRSAPGDALARVADHAAVIGATTPSLRDRATLLGGRLSAADRGDHPTVPVHGDFYESQLLVEDGAVVGLLDVDTAGLGTRIDDWATLLGHVALLEQVLPRPCTAVRWLGELLRTADSRWPADQVDPRVAAVLVGLATGPFRVQQPDWVIRTEQRLALAERWAAGAGRPR